MWLRASFVIIIVHLLTKDVAALYKPTKGSVWPKPVQEWKEDEILSFSSDHFAYEITHHSCKLLHRAITRCKSSIGSVEGIAKLVRQKNEAENTPIKKEFNDLKILKLKISLQTRCEALPYMGMNESYILTVAEQSVLTSKSIWGIIRGLETFSHLFYLSDDYKEVLISATDIVDYPQYPHRGMMIDTSRHYVPVNNILTVIDAMAMNKMNVFHWHIVDDQSFPYQSEAFPELSEKGAYYPTLTYTKEDIQIIVEFARERGIRVVPEFDTPGHALSWGASHPEILADCGNNGAVAMSAVRNVTYNLIAGLFAEVQALFPDKYFHLGGDEVNMNCWKQDSRTVEYMKMHGIENTYDIQKLYTTKVVQLLKKGTVPIVWEEVLLNAKAELSKDTLIQIWGGDWAKKMASVLTQGHKVLFSSYWYLNFKYYQYEFEDFYTGDPRLIVFNTTKSSSLGKNIVGGEACLWGEMVDDANILSRMWPRASAAAEVLWSFTDGTVPPEAYNRIQEHTCRMRRRGVPAAPPVGPGFCIDVNNAVLP